MDSESFRCVYASILAQFRIDAVGIVSVGESRTFEAFQSIVANGVPQNLDYLRRNAPCRARFEGLLDGAKTVVCCAVALDEMPPTCIEGGFARYCVCGDYHAVLRARLEKLAAFFKCHFPIRAYRICVDTAPILEREWAVRAGLGRIGFNRMLIHPDLGSHLMLGEILVDADLVPFSRVLSWNVAPLWCDEKEYSKLCCPGAIKCCHASRRCCVQACPTGALSASGYCVERCLAYWSTQHRGSIPDEMAKAMGARLWGCDLCQNACPAVRSAPRREMGQTPLSTLTFDEIFSLSGKALQRRLADTPLGDAHPCMIVRNACIVIGNTKNGLYRDTMAQIAQSHHCDWVRGSAQYALNQMMPLSKSSIAINIQNICHLENKI